MRKQIMIVSSFCLMAQCAWTADFQYQEKTQLTGGSALAMMKMAGTFSKQARQLSDPIVYSVYLQGNRMARVSTLNTEIIDLDAETVTTIDHGKKQYTVVTFEQMKRQMEKAAAKMQEEQAKQQKKQPDTASDTKLEFDVKVHETGATKDIAGLATKESILNLTMKATDTKSKESGSLAMTTDMWLAPEVPGYSAVREFYVRFASKVGMMVGESFSRSLAAMPAGMGEGTATLVKEMSKLQGVPVMQVMRVGSSLNGQPLPAASEAPLKSGESIAMPSGNELAKTAAVGVLQSKMKGFGGLAAGGLSSGGFGGFGKKKDKEKEKEPEKSESTAAATPSGDSAGYGVLMETTSEMSGFSSAAVDATKFQPPAGYKQIEVKQ
jgi:hypothetical protein